MAKRIRCCRWRVERQVVETKTIERTGVGKYWIVDPFEQSVTQLLLENWRYGLQETGGNHFAVTYFPDVNVDLDQIWSKRRPQRRRSRNASAPDPERLLLIERFVNRFAVGTRTQCSPQSEGALRTWTTWTGTIPDHHPIGLVARFD